MINEEMLEKLRVGVSSVMSDRRFRHTLGVEAVARKLSKIWLPERTLEIAAAAILHDVSKEMPEDVQRELILESDPSFPEEDLQCIPALHSFSAPYVVKRDFPIFATEDIISSIGKHTLGDAEMSVFDEIIFLADFIEESRTYPNAVLTRNFVLGSIESGETAIEILHKGCVMEIDSTIAFLVKQGKKVNEKALLAKAGILLKI